MTAVLSPREFLRFSMERGVLRFGRFITKAGRESPYFFNAGLFHDGHSLSTLGQYYADTALASGLAFDMLFGPAYKGIPLAVAMAMALAERTGRTIPFAFNRKETKDHGEGGNLIGAPLAGRVLIIDDVISAGTSVGESVRLIRGAGATPAGVIIALDRQERGYGDKGAVEEVWDSHGLPVFAIAGLADLIALLEEDPSLSSHLPGVVEYRARYGAVSGQGRVQNL